MGPAMTKVLTEEALTPFDTLVLTAYGLWRAESFPVVTFPQHLWPPKTTWKECHLAGQSWKVLVWDIQPGNWPIHPWPEVLHDTLYSLYVEGAAIAWFGLEGGFADPPLLFDPEQMTGMVYAALAEGFAFRCTTLPGQEYTSLTDEELKQLQELVSIRKLIGGGQNDGGL